MTLIENDSPKAQYTGPFIKGQLLPLTFPYIAKTDVKMLIDGVPAQLNIDFEIITETSAEHPVAYPDSAYIKNALPTAKQITLYRVTPLDQQAPFPQNSKFRSERIEQALDKLTMQQQEQEEQLARCIIAPITLETFNGQLPEPAADQALKWNAEGTELENYDIIGEQEAFEEAVNNQFEEQRTTIENRIGEFEEATNTQFSEFRNEINENLEAVLNAADKLEVLDEQVQVATDAAAQALASATRADEAQANADQAADDAELAADQAEETLTEVKQYVKDIEQELSQYTGLPMFVPLWSDHVYNDASYLRADHFSWHEAEIYVTAYNILVAQYDDENSVEEEENGIIYKRTPEGFRIADASQHDEILTRYTDGEKMWFYILDKENTRFKLPREKNDSHKYLYFYVGNYDRPDTEIQLGILAELANGLDLADVIANINTAAAEGLSAVNNATTTGVAEVEAVAAQNRDSVQALIDAGKGEITGLTTAGEEAITNLTNTGKTTIETTAELGRTQLEQIVAQGVPIATSDIFGLVKPDNTTITINGGVIRAEVPEVPEVNLATTDKAGIVRPDGETVTIVDGVISASAGCEYSVIEVYGDSTSGYRLWSDGYCEQWGTLQTVNNALSTVTLLKPYIDLNYVITGSCLNANTKLTNTQGVMYYLDTASEGIYILHKTASSFDAATQSPGYVTAFMANTAYWKASGYVS